MKFSFSTSPRPVYRHLQNIHKELPNHFLLLCLLYSQLFCSYTTFWQSKKHRHPQAETFWHMTNDNPIFLHCNGVFIFSILWLSSRNTQDILQSLASIFLVHMITTNIRSESVIFCLFFNHFFLFTSDCTASVLKTDIYVVSVQ